MAVVAWGTEVNCPVPTAARMAAPRAAPSEALMVRTGSVVHVGLELPPEWGTGAAAGGADLSHGEFHLAEDSDLFAHAEGDAFENGADEMGAGVAWGKADEGGAGVGVGEGAAFAGEVGKEEKVLGAGRCGGGFGDHAGVEIAGVFEAACFGVEEEVAEVLE